MIVAALAAQVAAAPARQLWSDQITDDNNFDNDWWSELLKGFSSEEQGMTACKNLKVPSSAEEQPIEDAMKLKFEGTIVPPAMLPPAPVQAPREIDFAVVSNIPSRIQVSEVWRAIEAMGFAGEVFGFSCPTRSCKQQGRRNRTQNLGLAYVKLADQG